MAYREARWTTAFVGGMFVAASLIGCTAPRPAMTQETVSPSAAAVTSPSFADQFPYLPTAGATLATATFAGSGSCPSGPVRIVVTSALGIEVRVPGASATTDGDTFFLSTSRLGADSGLPVSVVGDEQLGAGIGQEAHADPTGETVFPLVREMRADRGDFSYFHSIRCETYDGGLVEQALLTWKQAPFFSSIHPVDSGSRPHARGKAVVKAGVLTLYDIAADDTLDSVASRFGVRPVELLYINPSLGYNAPQLLAGDALNLDPRIR
jgi:hypothetical protein